MQVANAGLLTYRGDELMKAAVLGLSAAILLVGFAGAASAAPGGFHGKRITPYERAEINKSAARLAQVKRQAWSDGRLSPLERARIRVAEARYRAVMARAHR